MFPFCPFNRRGAGHRMRVPAQRRGCHVDAEAFWDARLCTCNPYRTVVREVRHGFRKQEAHHFRRSCSLQGAMQVSVCVCVCTFCGCDERRQTSLCAHDYTIQRSSVDSRF